MEETMPERILIVEDEPDMLLLLKTIITNKTAHEVVTTNNPFEALDLVKGGGFDLVITDLKMPGLDGIKVLESIRQFDKDIPVIFITAYGTIEAATEAMQKDAFDFITKPFRKEHILFTIEKALKLLHLQRENKAMREQLKK